MILDDFSRVKISQVDLKDDDTDYINATNIDVCYNNILYMYVCVCAHVCVRVCVCVCVRACMRACMCV